MIGTLLFGLVLLLIGVLSGFLIGLTYGALCYRPTLANTARRTEVEMNGVWVEVNS